MATSNRAALKTLQSNLAAGGYFRRVVIGDPKSPPDTMTAAVYTVSLTVPETTLLNPRMTWTTNVRIYARALDGRDEDVELALDEAVQNIVEDIMGDFTLGGSVAYILPTALNVRWGFLEVGGVWYRVVDIPLSYTVDDRATFAA